jgi:hypothetical protein
LAHIFIGYSYDLLMVLTVDCNFSGGAACKEFRNKIAADRKLGRFLRRKKSARKYPGRALPGDGVESETRALHKKFYAMRKNRFKMLRQEWAITPVAARAGA